MILRLLRAENMKWFTYWLRLKFVTFVNQSWLVDVRLLFGSFQSFTFISRNNVVLNNIFNGHTLDIEIVVISN